MSTSYFDPDAEPLTADDDIGRLAVRLVRVSEELRSLHREMAIVLITERQTKSQAWAQSLGEQGYTDKSREQIANYHALDHTTEIFKLRGDIEALTELRATLITLIQLKAAVPGAA